MIFIFHNLNLNFKNSQKFFRILDYLQSIIENVNDDFNYEY